MTHLELIALAAAVVLSLVHLLAGKLRFLEGTPRRRWLSIAGGASIAYVFLHVLPELAKGQEVLADVLQEPFRFIEHHVYLIALLGLAVFYGLERLAKTHRRPTTAPAQESQTRSGVFWISILSFSVYNFVIGYLLLHLEKLNLKTLLLFAIVMALHFLVNDFGLREHHQQIYHRIGRWLLAAAVLAGYAVGLVADVSEFVITVLFAFLAGGIILNVLKEELPEERESRFGAFALGAAGYSALLLIL